MGHLIFSNTSNGLHISELGKVYNLVKFCNFLR